MNRMLDLSVPTTGSGERLDRFLAAAQTDLSRSRLQSLIRAGRVRVNGHPARASRRLRDGDRVRVELPPAERATALVPEAVPLSIVFEDRWMLVLDKPAGLVVHPGAGVRAGTLVHALLHHHPAIASVGGAGRPGIVHRLDKDTSGLMLVAKTERAYRALVEAIRTRSVHRTYRALVWGGPAADAGRLEAAIGRDPRDRKRMAVVRRGGKPAVTRWRVIERFGPASELAVELETGRTHQIRVHMSAIGHPCCGDLTYGADPILAERLGLTRQWLHAMRLGFNHPGTGEYVEFTSKYPDDLDHALDLLADAQ